MHAVKGTRLGTGRVSQGVNGPDDYRSYEKTEPHF